MLLTSFENVNLQLKQIIIVAVGIFSGTRCHDSSAKFSHPYYLLQYSDNSVLVG
jgi:hypothetical protein